MLVPEIRQMESGARPKPVADACLATSRTWSVPESSSATRKRTSPGKIGSMSGTMSHASSALVDARRRLRTALEEITRPGTFGSIAWLSCTFALSHAHRRE
jgi:hypothetical protein